MKYKKQIKGFTIIEILVVITLLVMITGIISIVIFTTIRSSSKVRVSADVTQNGQFALSVIRSIVSDSRDVTAVGGVTINDCTASPSSTTSITFKRLDGDTTTVTCSGGVISSQSATLNTNIINTNIVSVQSCQFSCSQFVTDPYSIPIVNATFYLKDKNVGSSFENKSEGLFNMSTSLRTYSP